MDIVVIIEETLRGSTIEGDSLITSLMKFGTH